MCHIEPAAAILGQDKSVIIRVEEHILVVSRVHWGIPIVILQGDVCALRCLAAYIQSDRLSILQGDELSSINWNGDDRQIIDVMADTICNRVGSVYEIVCEVVGACEACHVAVIAVAVAAVVVYG